MTDPRKEFYKWLESECACELGLEWIKGMSPEEAYTKMERGDWLLWWAEKSGVDQKLMIKTTSLCVLTIEHLMSIECKEICNTFISWTNGKATDDEFEAAKEKAASFKHKSPVYAAVDAINYEYAGAVESVIYSTYIFNEDVCANEKLTADIVRQNIPFELFRTK